MQLSKSIGIGRDPSNNLVLEHPMVSRQHALLERWSEEYYLTDLNSTHGTFLDGKQISGTVELQPAQWINIGDYDFFFDGDNLQDSQGMVIASFKKGIYRSDEPLSINESLLLPFGKRESLKWFIGSLLVLIPIISFFGDGYRYRLMQNSVKGISEMPEWDNWADLFTKGMLFFLVRLIYMVVPAFVLLLFLLASLNTVNLTGGGLFLLLAPGFIISLLSSFTLPMALARLTATGQFREAFNFYAIIQGIKTVFRQYLLITFFILALWVIVTLLSQIPYLGLIVAIIGAFYVYIFSAFQYGDLYRRGEA